MGSALKDPLAFLLGDTAENAEDLPLPCFALKALKPMKYFLLSFVANAAGVVENELGISGFGHLRVASGEERSRDLFRVVGVHLAAERFEVEGSHERCKGIEESRSLGKQRAGLAM